MNFRAIEFAVVAFIALSVLAPTSTAFGLSGATFMEEVSPGQELVHTISISAGENESLKNMTAEVFGFERNLAGSNIELSPDRDTGPYSARPFLSVEPKSFDLEPGERKTLLLTGTVPDDVGSGGRYALVSISTEPAEPAERGGGQVMVSTGIQVTVLLTIKDSELIKTGEISDLSTSMVDGNVTVDVTFDNTGNVHYKPFVGANLLDEDGEVAASVEPAETRRSILPTNSRFVSMTLVPDAVLEPGTYTVEATVALDDGTVLATEETTVEV